MELRLRRLLHQVTPANAISGNFRTWSVASMGRILSRGCPKGRIHFLILQFLCSTWQPFLRPDPHTEWPARAGAVKAGPPIGRPPTGLALMASSTTAYLLWSG